MLKLRVFFVFPKSFQADVQIVPQICQRQLIYTFFEFIFRNDLTI